MPQFNSSNKRKEKKEMKQNLPSVRQFGQSSLTSSFLARSRGSNGGEETRSRKKSISLSDFLNRKIGEPDDKSTKEKPTSFSSVRFDSKELGSKRDGAVDGFVLDRAVFQRFNRPLIGERGELGDFHQQKIQSDPRGDGDDSRAGENPKGDGDDSRKRKNPFGVSSGEDEKPRPAKYLVVLGDDPKLKPKRRERKQLHDKAKPFYNHYESGSGWWDGDKEGIDSEEVGCNDAWEGMGSTTLGGLEWH